MWLSAVSNSFLYSSGQPPSLFPLGPVRPLGNVTPALYGPAESGGGLALGRSPTLKWKGEQIAIKRPLPPSLLLLATQSHAHLFLLHLWVCLPARFPRDQTPVLLSSSSPSVNEGSTPSEILMRSPHRSLPCRLPAPCVELHVDWRLTHLARFDLQSALRSFLSFHYSSSVSGGAVGGLEARRSWI